MRSTIKCFAVAIAFTALTIAYYAWMIPAWRRLEVPKKSSRRVEPSSTAYKSTVPSTQPSTKRKSKGKSAFERWLLYGEDYKDTRALPMPTRSYYIVEPRYRCNSTLKVNTSRDANYVIKVVGAYSGELIMMCFVPADTSQEIDIPSGVFELRYTSGTTWYGEKDLFGPNASYTKADRVFDFKEWEGYEVTLYRVANGNLRMSNIREEDF